MQESTSFLSGTAAIVTALLHVISLLKTYISGTEAAKHNSLAAFQLFSHQKGEEQPTESFLLLTSVCRTQVLFFLGQQQ